MFNECVPRSDKYRKILFHLDFTSVVGIFEVIVVMEKFQIPLVGVIDEGTCTVVFSVYTSTDFKEVASHKEELTLIHPQDGWVEQDPLETMRLIRLCIKEACKKLEKDGFNVKDIATIGITNQRETTIVWDKKTGEPLYNAIVWNDNRTTVTVDEVLAKLPDQSKNHFKDISGLPISSYFSALKLKWMKDNLPNVRKAMHRKRCLAGTVDSWIVWNLTGGVDDGLHITDVTNASRTLLMNIETTNWDPLLLKTFSIYSSILPEIRSCSEIYGRVKDKDNILNDVPISGILGNQQASLLGQMCLKIGQAKCTYRSGCFLLCNTGTDRIISTHGLLTTVAYKLGKNAPCNYALEGSVAVGHKTLHWIKNNLGILSDVDQAEKDARKVHSTGDIYFVPAFSGLYAPYWRKDARAIICGLTQFTNKNHIIRASLEAICFQIRDILEVIKEECDFDLSKLYVDGPTTRNDLLMQLQSDLSGMPVFRAQLVDTTAFGAALCAANAEGINLCKIKPEKRSYDFVFYDTFLPTTTNEERNLRYFKWKKAVERSMGWIVPKKSRTMTNEKFRMLSSIPASIFLISLFAMFVHGKSKFT